MPVVMQASTQTENLLQGTCHNAILQAKVQDLPAKSNISPCLDHGNDV